MELPGLRDLTIKQFTRWKPKGGEMVWLEPEPVKPSALKTLNIHSLSFPLGRDVEYLLQGLSYLQHFSWIIDGRPEDHDGIWEIGSHVQIGVTELISRGLLPLSTWLLELNLLISNYSRNFPFLDSRCISTLDFRQYSRLRILRIQADFLFQLWDDRDGFIRQLPYSLEGLLASLSPFSDSRTKISMDRSGLVGFIFFNYGENSNTLMVDKNSPPDYDWFLPLAQYKETNLPRLSRVKIQDSLRWWGFDLVSPGYPEHISKSFEHAEILLKVVINVPNLAEQEPFINYTGPFLADPNLSAEDEQMILCQNNARRREFILRQAVEDHCYQF
ncbi:hypothetical protein HYALB_00013915 [Hymenoscyphus albidus]|uniref:Uncharacterized protein n=1 Tax=Hymenoscyphus albidus TaxID=595503 RepID=A0A9N9LZR3_9HELO|nr:hypothetical protein HYALB_00013915 [Hymenoscyphus albidus]